MRYDEYPIPGLPVSYLAYDGDNKVGFMIVCLLNDEGAIVAYITTNRKYRRKGYATEMVQWLMKQSNYVKTGWSGSTQISRNMFVNIGFKKEGDWLVWRKQDNSCGNK